MNLAGGQGTRKVIGAPRRAKMKFQTFLLTVMGKDQPGIISKVTAILFRHGCNLEDISMTILEGEFAMMLVACLRERRQKEKILRSFHSLERNSGLSFFWKDLRRKLTRGEQHVQGAETYLVSAIGRDRTGIVHRVSSLLAHHGLNITDLNSRLLGYGREAVYSMMLEVDIPRKFSISRLKRALQRLSHRLRIEIRMRPAETITS